MTTALFLSLNEIKYHCDRVREWLANCLSRRARSSFARQNRNFMYYVYVLQSSKNKDIYIGFTENLKIRFRLHNAGKVRSTKAYKPWNLIYYEAYRSKKDATKREKQLKIHAVKNDILKRLENSLGG